MGYKENTAEKYCAIGYENEISRIPAFKINTEQSCENKRSNTMKAEMTGY